MRERRPSAACITAVPGTGRVRYEVLQRQILIVAVYQGPLLVVLLEGISSHIREKVTIEASTTRSKQSRLAAGHGRFAF